MNISEQVASFIVNTEMEKISPEAVSMAKNAILDCVGVTVAGSADETGRIITGLVKDLGGQPAAGVIGGGFWTSPPLAALANGTMAHALDYDDVNHTMTGHPSVPLVPAVFALGEDLKSSGEMITLAYIIGFEVETKVGAGVNINHYQKGWHATATLGTLGAAAAASKLLGLDVVKTRMALGIAASAAAGIRQNFGTMTKPYHAGQAAKNGVLAAMLAQRGFTADANILEAPLGFCNLFTENGSYNLDKITAHLGDPLDILKPGVVIKQYPSCAGTHRALDGMLALVKEYGIEGKEVEKVQIKTISLIPKILIHTRPRTGLEGKFSMQYCMSAAILDKKVGLQSFTDPMVNRSEIQELVKKVDMITYTQAEEGEIGGLREDLPEIVTVKLKSGKELKKEVKNPKGSPQDPLSKEQLMDKFIDCVNLVLPSRRGEQAAEFINKLEKLSNISELMKILV
ncbi:MAG: MmgE/PrpD family protein [Candidatus Tectomicrobia bacterium]|uniref:MmgE/PrpD family protein n=1 Tax=Tectimicrobiota bacterium TaxID=2528274 RepID=A0A933GLM6_UNCTE|nr:MmgE/PrpD family protein [Candidatus Tectomicrobia bacterium]